MKFILVILTFFIIISNSISMSCWANGYSCQDINGRCLRRGGYCVSAGANSDGNPMCLCQYNTGSGIGMSALAGLGNVGGYGGFRNYGGNGGNGGIGGVGGFGGVGDIGDVGGVGRNLDSSE
jgi:hypothetical protein